METFLSIGFCVCSRNIQLAFFGGILAFAGCFLQDGAKIAENGFMQGLAPGMR